MKKPKKLKRPKRPKGDRATPKAMKEWIQKCKNVDKENKKRESEYNSVKKQLERM